MYGQSQNINELRRLLMLGQITPAEFEQVEQQNALAEMVMPRPRNDIAPMPQNAMRFENGPDEGKMVDLNFAQQSRPQAMQPSLGEAVEVAGRGRGRYSQDGRSVVFPDGSTQDLFPQASAAAAEAAFKAQKRQMDMQKGALDIEKTGEDIEKSRFDRQPKPPSAPAGYQWRGDRLEPIPGGPAEVRADKLTDVQGRSSTYGQRAAEAHEVLDAIGQSGDVQPGLIKRAGEAVPLVGSSLGTALNWTQSAPQQQVEQAQRNFVNAVLRRESGAVISDSEFDNARKQYFPQPGDTPQVIAQKKTNRETVIRGFADEAGPAKGKVLGAGKGTQNGVRRYNPQTGRIE